MSDRLYAWRNGWRWAGWYIRRGRFVAAIRELWDAYVRGHNGETCQDCGRPYLHWRADDRLYGEVTSRWPRPDGESASGLFCLACFSRMADRKGMTIMWVPRRFEDWFAEYEAAAPAELAGRGETERPTARDRQRRRAANDELIR